MKVNVYGLTDATISFNTIGMILRGKYIPEGLNSCSVARNLELKDESQVNELMQIARCGLIRVEAIEEKPKEVISLEQSILKVEEVKVTEETKMFKEVKAPEPKTTKTTKTTKKDKNRRKSTNIKAPKVAEIPPVDNSPKQIDVETDPRVVVMTDSGPKGGKMIHKMNGEIDESDPRCKASMDAAKKLKEEEEEILDLINESLLDPSERNGQSAIIGTGNGKTVSMSMKNSVLGERIEPNFLDLELDDDYELESAFIDNDSDNDLDKSSDQVESAFIDFGDDENDELDDAFIEM